MISAKGIFANTSGSRSYDSAAKSFHRWDFGSRSARQGAGRTEGQSKIGRGVTFYSYQDELVTHRMRIEDCVAAVSGLGADGVELIGEEGVPNYPMVSDKFVADWFSWMEKYHTRPICYDFNCDINLHADQAAYSGGVTREDCP